MNSETTDTMKPGTKSGWPHFTESGLPVPVTDDQRQIDRAAIKAEAEAVEVSDDYKAAMTLWRTTWNLPKSGAKGLFRHYRLRKIGPIIHARQQGMQALAQTHSGGRPSNQALISRADARAARFMALVAATQTYNEDSPELFHAPTQADAVRQRLIDDAIIADHIPGPLPEDIGGDDPVTCPAVLAGDALENQIPFLLTRAVHTLRLFEIAYLEHWAEMNPESHKVEIAAQVTPGKSKAELDDLKDQLLRLNTPKASTFKAAAVQSIFAAWEPAQAALWELFDHAKDLLNKMKEGAIASETSFFADHGLPREATSASRRFDSLLSQLDHEIAKTEGAHEWGAIPNAADKLAWFNIKDLI